MGKVPYQVGLVVQVMVIKDFVQGCLQEFDPEEIMGAEKRMPQPDHDMENSTEREGEPISRLQSIAPDPGIKVLRIVVAVYDPSDDKIQSADHDDRTDRVPEKRGQQRELLPGIP